jgi:hypothetical protein
MIKLPERHTTHGGPASRDIPVSDQYESLGRRMKLMARGEEVNSGGPGQPVARDHQCDLISSVELGGCTLGGLGGDNAVVGREPAGEVALDGRVSSV